ncbi:Hypothetical predicted protein [Octopus vulgaris]|uniref:Uncharacterized protein n=1 Tax=Octopus vulgaris TaxID=6645 RepID=A0AA36BU76_OCTVU|nr:Hypothetical predicted protein [Octopus vulgaris]
MTERKEGRMAVVAVVVVVGGEGGGREEEEEEEAEEQKDKYGEEGRMNAATSERDEIRWKSRPRLWMGGNEISIIFQPIDNRRNERHRRAQLVGNVRIGRVCDKQTEGIASVHFKSVQENGLQIENAKVSSQSACFDPGLRFSCCGMYLCPGRIDGRFTGNTFSI